MAIRSVPPTCRNLLPPNRAGRDPGGARGRDGSMHRDIFTPEHDAFRQMVREFIAREVTPYHAQWERDGMVARDVWLAAGRAGLLGIDVDGKHGGGGSP